MGAGHCQTGSFPGKFSLSCFPRDRAWRSCDAGTQRIQQVAPGAPRSCKSISATCAALSERPSRSSSSAHKFSLGSGEEEAV